MDALKCCVIWNLVLSCCSLNRIEQTRSNWKGDPISWAPDKLRRCRSSFSLCFSPALSVLKWYSSFSYQICTCQIKLYTSNLSHSFRRHCSAFHFVISKLRCIQSSSTDEALNCPSSPYERGQKVCAYRTDQCNAQMEGLGLSLLWSVMIFGSQIYTVCDFLVMKFTLAASPRHVSCKHKERTVLGLCIHIVKESISSPYALLLLWLHPESKRHS